MDSPPDHKSEEAFVFRDPRPEIDCCRACGFDLRNRPEDYLLCPECGTANNRTTAWQRSPDQLAAADGWLAWRYWTFSLVLGVIAFLPGLVLTSMAAHWLALPWSWPRRAGVTAMVFVAPTIFVAAMMRMPPAFRWWPRLLVMSFLAAVGIAFCATLVLGVLSLAMP